MRLGAALLAALLAAACTLAERPTPTPLPPTAPPALETLPPPALSTPAPAATPSPSPTGPALPTVVPASPPPAAAAVVGRLQAVLDEWHAADGSPGAVVGLRLADGRTAVVAAGETDDEGGVPIEPGHRFRIGSITKTFVAVLLVQLAEDGLLDLDHRLADHLPWAPHAESVTLRQLLEHTSGMPDFAGLPAYRQQLLFNPARAWQARDAVELVDGLELEFEPGSRWSYSNTNYLLAGLVAEEATGSDLALLLRERISVPLGLASTFLDGLEPAPPVETAGHYDLDGDGRAENVRPIPYTALVTSGAAAGGLSSSAGDVLAFAGGLFAGRLLTPAGLERLTEPTKVSPAYGMGVVLFRRAGRLLIGHAGALPGYTALFVHAPEEGITVVALVNRTGADVERLVEAAFGVVE